MPIFSLQSLAQQAILQLDQAACDERAKVIGYCLLPSTMQAIIGFEEEHDIGGFLYHYKWLASHAIICLEHGEFHEKLYRKGKFKPWMNRFEKSNLTGSTIVKAKLDYIHQDPVKRSLAASAAEWPYSSAGDWAGVRKGIIEIYRNYASLLPPI